MKVPSTFLAQRSRTSIAVPSENPSSAHVTLILEAGGGGGGRGAADVRVVELDSLDFKDMLVPAPALLPSASLPKRRHESFEPRLKKTTATAPDASGFFQTCNPLDGRAGGDVRAGGGATGKIGLASTSWLTAMTSSFVKMAYIESNGGIKSVTSKHVSKKLKGCAHLATNFEKGAQIDRGTFNLESSGRGRAIPSGTSNN